MPIAMGSTLTRLRDILKLLKVHHQKDKLINRPYLILEWLSKVRDYQDKSAFL